MNVSWEPPALPNGVLEGYRLVYEPCTPVDGEGMAGGSGEGPEGPGSASVPAGVSKIVTVDVKGTSPLWMKVKDLAEGVTYRFRIRAKTFAYGPDVEANITTGPGEGAGGTWGTDGVREAMGWGLAWFCATLCPLCLVCGLQPCSGPQVPLAPQESPSSPAMARPSPSTGPVGTPAKGPSPDTSSRPGPQVPQLLSIPSSGSGWGETEAGGAEWGQVLGPKVWRVVHVLIMGEALLSGADGTGGAWRDVTPCPGVSCRASPPLPAPLSLPDEGLWDILIKDIPKEVTSYTFSMDILKQGVSYDFRVIAVNDYGYGTPSTPSPSVSGVFLGDPVPLCWGGGPGAALNPVPGS